MIIIQEDILSYLKQKKVSNIDEIAQHYNVDRSNILKKICKINRTKEIIKKSKISSAKNSQIYRVELIDDVY